MILKNIVELTAQKVQAEGTRAEENIFFLKVHLLRKAFSQQNKVCQWEATDCRLKNDHILGHWGDLEWPKS